MESCSVMCFVASVGTGGDSVRSGCGFWRGSCSGSANAVGALGSRSRQLLPACVPRHVARLTARRPCCSLRQVSTAQLPLDPARLRGVKRHALPPAQLTSAQLSSLRCSSAHLSSALGPSACRPHSVYLLRSASRRSIRAASSWYGRPGPLDLALLDLLRAGWAVRNCRLSPLPTLFQPTRLWPRIPQWTQPSQLDLRATGH